MTKEDLDQCEEEDRTWLEEVFEEIYPWCPMYAPGFRIAWIRCEGIPINLWTKNCFAKLTMCFGDVVAIAECTSNFSRLDFARIQIRTSTKEPILQFMKVRLNGHVFSIRLVEELNPSEREACQCVEGQLEMSSEASKWELNGSDFEPSLTG